MKKVLLVTVIMICAFALVACNSGTPDTPDANPPADTTNPPADTPDDTDAPPADEQVVTLKISHVEAEGDTLQEVGNKFKEYCETESGGTIKVELYPNSELGDDRVSTEGVALGSIEMALPGTSQMVAYSEDFGICDMPFIFSSAEEAFAKMDGELGDALNEQLKGTGLVNLGFYFIGERHVSSNVQPVNTPADLAGVKIRVMESPVYIQTFTALGANPTPISFSELYTALQQKTVDAEDNPASVFYSSKLHEVQTYYSLTGHTMSFGVVIINEQLYNSLSDRQRDIINAGVQQFMITEQRSIKVSEEGDYLQKLTDEGCIVNEVSAENKALFQEAVQPVYEYFADVISPEIFELAQK